jgi:outer membrane protein OmpA-like peptidoglycan-associated protein
MKNAGPLFKFIVLVLLLLQTPFAHSQLNTTLTATNADCSGIIDLQPADSVFGPTSAPKGYGNCLEIKGDKSSLYAFEQEHNTVWYRFRAPWDCKITLDVIPISIKDDYDFLVYKYNGKSFCSDIAAGKLQPVRSCLSRNDPSQGSKTGLSYTATDEFVHSGPGASYSKYITAKKGEVFVLVLDNVYESGKGHTLRLHYSKPIPPVNNKPVVKDKNQNTPAPVASKALITVVDKSTQTPLKANFKLYKKSSSKTAAASADSSTSAEFNMDLKTKYFIRAEAQNYFGFIYEFTSPAIASNLNIKIEMERLSPGKTLVFEDILFYTEEARILPESAPSLETLLKTMKQYPGLVVEIDGHVNCPVGQEGCDTKAMQTSNMNLSVARAKAVVDYLIQNGIEERRLSYKGYGATKMLYPDARSEDKKKHNRRVEVLIIAVE